MADSVDRELRGLDAERPLPPSLSRRLEDALLADAATRSGADADTEALFDAIDAPRSLPAATRAALEEELIGAASVSSEDRRGRALLAVAAVLLLVVGTLAALRAARSPSAHQVASLPTRSMPEAGTLPVLQAPTTAAPQPEALAAPAASPTTRTTARRSTTTTTWDCGLCARNGVGRDGAGAAAGPTPPTTPPGGPGTTAVAAAALREAGVDRVDPSSGSRAGGTIVTLTGAGFTGASGVLFGSSSAANFTVVSDTEIRVMAPPSQNAQTVPVAVTYPDGSTTPTSDSGPFFTYT